MTKQRRVKFVALNEHLVLDWFDMAIRPTAPGQIAVPKIDGLPSDCEVLSVSHDWRLRQFLFLVHHPSFPEVRDFEEPPFFTINFNAYRAVPLRSKADEPIFSGSDYVAGLDLAGDRS